MFKPVLTWPLGGALLAIAFVCAILLVKPIGVSTQFVIADTAVWDVINPDIIITDENAKSGYSSPNAYLNKSGGKYAANAANPLNYSFVFVLAMMGGAFLSALLKGDKPQNKDEKTMPAVWRNRFGDSAKLRYTAAFIAGFLVLYGARLAGGCTSGHMMSGMMQTALSGYIFAAGAFLAALPIAIILFNKKG
ncbi:MAG: hypothetical protein CL561_01085 [Alphaproteobacteria bacterium]|nr:hypothetical protein [Alphaproteobacteria bacterium]|tara:strand:- start:752 stop:1327 length:576 start_codon:yes stop_codon:yes gene_type:complete